jgi:hypothetical protein
MSTDTHNKVLTLTADDKARLEKVAPLFDVGFLKTSDGNYLMRTRSDAVTIEECLPACSAHFRLLAEICERVVPWVYFHFARSCRDSLLNLTDERMRRIAELYSIARDKKMAAMDVADEEL